MKSLLLLLTMVFMVNMGGLWRGSQTSVSKYLNGWYCENLDEAFGISHPRVERVANVEKKSQTNCQPTPTMSPNSEITELLCLLRIPLDEFDRYLEMLHRLTEDEPEPYSVEWFDAIYENGRKDEVFKIINILNRVIRERL